jgi:putative ABC transport system permease protein
MSDLKHAFRQLRKHPGFTTVAVLTLALGIGANTAIFSVVNAVLLRPLPYPEAERLVWMSERGMSEPSLSIAYPNFEDWQKQQTVFENLGAYKLGSFNLTQEGDPLRLEAAFLSSGTFAALGVQPVVGRWFSAEDDRIGAAPVVVLSHALWQGRFGGRADVLNQIITLDNTPHTVVGVMPAGFAFPTTVDLWTSMGALVGTQRFHYQERGYHSGFFAVAKLKHGVSLEQARGAMAAVADRLEGQYPENRRLGVRIDPLLDNYVSSFRSTVWILFGAVALVLLIACTNVANLLLARAAARQKEMAVRAALGASRWQTIQQSVTEGLVLSFTGGTLGLCFAYLAMPVILAFGRGRFPRLAEADLDGRVLLFTTAVAILTGLIFGLVPAWQATRTDLQRVLNETGRGNTVARASLRQGLVIGEVALTLILLVGAGLLLRTLLHLQAVNPGFVQERILSFRFDLPEEKYVTEEQRSLFYQALLEKLRLLPGVQSAGVTSRIPLDPTDDFVSPFLIEGEAPPAQGEFPSIELSVVSPDYFRTLGIPVIRGRSFTDLDDRRHLQGKVPESLEAGERWILGLSKIIVDEEFARRYWPNADPVGRKVRLPWRPNGPVLEVVGVVRHVRLDRLNEPGKLVQGYLSFLEAPRRGMAVVVRTSLAPKTLIPAVRRQLLALDAQQPLYNLRTIAELRDTSIALQRTNLLLLGTFAILALILAMIGLYGVLSYAVIQQHRELGVRLALGAKRADVLRLVLRHGMSLTLLGMLLGLAMSFALTRVLSHLLYQTGPTDWVTFLVVCGLLTVIALLACLIPARRATLVNPIEALRYE